MTGVTGAPRVDRRRDPADVLDRALEKHFGLSGFRPGQRDVIEPLLAGRDVLALMPTGSGKSLCFQLASHVLPPRTVVLSPLIALMKDQVDKLRSQGDEDATFLNSSLPREERRARLRALEQGAYRLVYVAPEALRNRGLLALLRRDGVSLLVVDEAHCISQWGHDFRIDYRRIGQAAELLGRPPILAATATAPPAVQRDIIASLDLESPRVVTLPFDRPNLHLAVRACATLARRRQALLDAIDEVPRGTSVVVYVGRRKRADELAALLTDRGRSAIAYHAGLDRDERVRRQDRFMRGEVDIVVATNAFGMGVDKPDIRLIVHFSLPPTLEAYYQEAGRAGRDGRPARCLLLYGPGDRAYREALADRDQLDEGLIHTICRAMTPYRQGQFLLIPPGAIEAATGAPTEVVRRVYGLLEAAGHLVWLPDLARDLFLTAVDRDASLGAHASDAERGLLQFFLDHPEHAGTWIDAIEVAEAAGVELDAFEDALHALRWEGALDHRSANPSSLLRLSGRGSYSPRELLDLDEAHRQAQRSKLEAITRYARGGQCRRALLRRYFGEQGVPDRCGTCDACEGVQHIEIRSAPGSAGSWVNVRPILLALRNRQFPLGRTGLAAALTDKARTPLARSLGAMLAQIDRAIEAGLLETFFARRDQLRRYPLLRVTAEGERRLCDGEEIYLLAGSRSGKRPRVRRVRRHGARPGEEPAGTREGEPEGSFCPDVLRHAKDRLGEDVLVMFRCGAFWEFRGPDAERVAPILDLKKFYRGSAPRRYAVVGAPRRRGRDVQERLTALGHEVVAVVRRGSGWAPADHVE